jgi:predicted DCC family thiol-disulfide oxidoreductase YuxK
MPAEGGNPIILYDGVCGLCNRLNQFVLKRDKRDLFRFAPLQSKLAAAILARHGLRAGDLDTIYLVQNFKQTNEKLLSRSDAIVYVLSQLGTVWRIAGYLFRLLPQVARNWQYALVARNRYRTFGKTEYCPLPSAKDRDKFLDIA